MLCFLATVLILSQNSSQIQICPFLLSLTLTRVSVRHPKSSSSSFFFQTEGRKLLADVDSGTTVVVRRNPEDADCEVCAVEGSTVACSPTEKTLTNVVGLTLDFSCPRPQDVFSVDIKKLIGQSLISLLETFFRYFIIQKMESCFSSSLLRMHPERLHPSHRRSPSWSLQRLPKINNVGH